MPLQELLLISCLMIVLGLVLLWTIRLIYASRRTTTEDPIRLILTLTSYLMVVGGLLTVCVLMVHILAIIAIPLLAFVLMMAVEQYRACERRALLWMMAEAATKGIPLSQAARAFADEQPGEIGLRVNRLGDMIDGGVPLPLAFQRSALKLPTEAALALHIGCELGNVGPLLKESLIRDNVVEDALRFAKERGLYLGTVLGVFGLSFMFQAFKVLPVYSKLVGEFGIPLPPLTASLFTIVQQGQEAGIAIAVVLAVGAATLGPILALSYLDKLPRNLIGMGWLAKRIDIAIVLRHLATAMRLCVPLPRAFQAVTFAFPRLSMRRRLASIEPRVQAGGDWCEAMCAQGLLTPAEAAVLNAAQRVGNLAWACDELATARLRRTAFRLRFWTNLLFPILIVIIGLIAMALSVAMLLPLLSLVQGLA